MKRVYQFFRDPIITPFTKYFCTKGYTIKIQTILRKRVDFSLGLQLRFINFGTEIIGCPAQDSTNGKV